MDHNYIRSQNRLPGFQVIETRSGPDHTYVKHKDSTPQKRGSKRNLSTPTGKTPKHENKRIELVIYFPLTTSFYYINYYIYLIQIHIEGLGQNYCNYLILYKELH